MSNEHQSTVTEVELSEKELFHLLNQPDVILAEEEAEIQKLGNEPIHEAENFEDGEGRNE